ncbi:MAG: c-type cytochrome [Chloroflexi bacterium]|nr:c-type cytochrome [Chloroflexota bacterium]
MKRIIGLLVVMLALGLGACDGDASESEAETAIPATLEPGNPARGEKLYRQTIIGTGNSAGCITCHSLEPDVTLVGPSHATIGAEAEGRLPGMSAEDFLRESIVDPNEQISDGFTVGTMYSNYGEELLPQEIEDLAAYMLTLK